MSKKTKFIIVFLGLGILFFVFNYLVTKDRNYEVAFNGKIQKIEYDGKRQPTVLIGDTTYGFSFGRDKNELMVGDSLVKFSKNRTVYHYRKGELINEYSW